MARSEALVVRQFAIRSTKETAPLPSASLIDRRAIVLYGVFVTVETVRRLCLKVNYRTSSSQRDQILQGADSSGSPFLSVL